MIPTDPWPESVARARHLDRLGFDHLWVYDHLTWRRYRDRDWHATHPWLTGIAAVTDRIRIGTMVSNLNYRDPVLLAKDAMTMDHISGGRLTIGLGAAGLGFDAELFGEPLTPGQRVDRLAEFTAAFDGVLRGTVASHAGEYYEFHDAQVLPRCLQSPRVPIAIAAGGPRSLRLAAECGDAWVTTGDTMGDDRTVAGTERAVRDQNRAIDRACESTGRDPASIDRIFLAGNTEDRPLATPEAFDEFVERYRSIGFTDLVVHDPRPGDPMWGDDPAIIDEIAARYCHH